MATNQVIHGSNRVVENPNRYKLNAVSGQANTYDLEKVPGTITDNGTPYGKAVLDKIDNVLSYLTPSVEKVGTETPYTFTYFLELPNSISGDSFEAILKNFINTNTIPVNFKITGSSAYNGYRYSTSSTNHYINILATSGSSLVTGALTINEILSNLNDTHYFRISPYGDSSSYRNEIIFDFTNYTNVKFKYKIGYSSSSPCKLYYSYDNTTWISLIDPIVNNTEAMQDIPNNCYLKLEMNSYILAYKFEFLIDGFITTYQNQFTLDNNGQTFTNNQRVLIETDKNVETLTISGTTNISKCGKVNTIFSKNSVLQEILVDYNLDQYSKIPLKITTDSENGIKIDNGDTPTRMFMYYAGSYNFTNNELEYILQQTTYDSSYYIQNVAYESGKNIYYIFDVSKLSSYSIKCRFNFEVLLQSSNDGINWVDIQTISSGAQTINISTKYKYIRFVISSNNAISIYYLYFDSVNYSYELEMELPYQDVTSNTLNGVDIPTLLQPSTKYELVYNESVNKFEIGKKPLFDITLTEPVSEIALTGITELLETNKCYLLNIGGTSPTSTNIYIGNSETIYTSFDTTYRSVTSIFTIEKNNDDVKIIIPKPSVSTSIKLKESIWTYGTINAGTRIIIREVA